MWAKGRRALLHQAPLFKTTIHQGSDLKKCRHGNPNPKQPNSIPYWRNRTNGSGKMCWMVWDYLFCCSCIRAAFGLFKQHIAHQQKIKQQQRCEPLLKLSKKSGGTTVGWTCGHASWCWNCLHGVSRAFPHNRTRYPHNRHGNAGKTSHSAKTSGMNMTTASRETGGYCVKAIEVSSGEKCTTINLGWLWQSATAINWAVFVATDLGKCTSYKDVLIAKWKL